MGGRRGRGPAHRLCHTRHVYNRYILIHTLASLLHATNSTTDEIEYLPPKPPLKGVLGGAGTYSALGARLFSPAPDLSRSVGWIVDQGSDFPSSIKSTIESWETGALFRSDTSRLTTRGWNGYVSSAEPDRRAFKYVTPKKRLTGRDLAGTPLLQSKAFHMVCSPDRCRELVNEITTLRKKEAAPGTYVRPLFIWEPVPDLCTPDELLNCTNTLPLVDVCSPNHAELAGFMGGDGIDPETGGIDAAAVERSCEQLLASMPSQNCQSLKHFLRGISNLTFLANTE